MLLFFPFFIYPWFLISLLYHFTAYFIHSLCSLQCKHMMKLLWLDKLNGISCAITVRAPASHQMQRQNSVTCLGTHKPDCTNTAIMQQVDHKPNPGFLCGRHNNVQRGSQLTASSNQSGLHTDNNKVDKLPIAMMLFELVVSGGLGFVSILRAKHQLPGNAHQKSSCAERLTYNNKKSEIFHKSHKYCSYHMCCACCRTETSHFLKVMPTLRCHQSPELLRESILLTGPVWYQDSIAQSGQCSVKQALASSANYLGGMQVELTHLYFSWQLSWFVQSWLKSSTEDCTVSVERWSQCAQSHNVAFRPSHSQDGGN